MPVLLFLIALFCLSCGKDHNQFSVEGLKKQVEVYTDPYGIPHILAQNNHDMMLALGYTMASDRLYQMDVLRRIGSGRLSEIFGKKTVEADVLLRTLGIRKQMLENWKAFKASAPKEMITEVDAFLKGVNLFIKKGPKPMETKLLRYQIEPFSFEDSLSVIGYMGLNFAEALVVDVMYSDLLDELEPEEVELIFSRGSEDTKINTFHTLNYKPSHRYYSKLGDSLSTLLNRFTLFHGSNAWALSPKRSKSNKALLANDPHIGFSLPGTWYEAHIKSPTYESYGHYVPLVPFPGLSHNKDRAWGITMAKFNDMDLYQESFHPDDKNKVMYKKDYVDVLTHKEFIKIKGQKKPKKLTVKRTPHGPLLDETKHGKEKKGLSLSWQFLSPQNNVALGMYLLSKTKRVEDFASALKQATSPSFSFTFADSKGNIGWHVMGRIPILPESSNGKSILDGANGKEEYQGYLTIEENPNIYNPESGLIVNANHKPLIKTTKNIGGMWLSNQRHRRIRELLQKQEKWSLEELKKVQTDQEVYHYSERFLKHYKSIKAQSPIQKKALNLMINWNAKAKPNKPEATIHYTFLVFLVKNILFDELGKERFKRYTGVTDTYTFLDLMLQKPSSKLWDNKKTKEIEDKESIIQKSFTDTIKHLVKKRGGSIENWSWSKAHTLTFKHSLGAVKPLNLIFNLGPYPSKGGGDMVSNFGGDKGDLEHKVKYGPSTRRLIDFEDTDHSYGVLPTGNSGRRFSKHYKDQISLFINDKYRKQLIDFKEIKAISKKTIYKAL